ncbi:hypothetical protein EH228_08725 [Erwinia endophytica]|uniref:hypothetical protein n=1 Tax=Erwinia endophytica TaxID=1563158 RepID=UPI001265DE94|nr:hypothetical protein [Erwinia endophytica]KAB8312256.1 hypothetical protein EH228_08725 [Erwinia endophytica]
MKKWLFFCVLMAVSTLGNAASNADNEAYSAPPLPDKEIVMQVYDALRSEAADPQKDKFIKDHKLQGKMSGYIDAFDIDNNRLKFTVTRLASERMTKAKVKVVFQGSPSDDFKKYMENPVYDEYYKVKSSKGVTAIYEAFNMPSADEGFRGIGIGSVYIVDYEG